MTPTHTEQIAPDTLTPVPHVEEHRAHEVVALFQHTHWAQHRTEADVAAMIKATAVNVGLEHNGTLVAYARALSDGRYKAIVEDVVVAPHLRGQHVGHQLMHLLVTHEQVAGVEEIELYCVPELVHFYSQHSVTPVTDQVFMRGTSQKQQ